MAKRSSNRAPRAKTQSAPRTSYPRGKSEAEARVERFTWFFLVLIFAVLQIIPPGTLPNWFVPFSGAVILLGSGIYQYSRRWRVSPVTWLAGGLMIIFVLLNLYLGINRSFLGESLIVFAGVILFGLITGET